MKLFVLGGSGRTGRHVLDLALARGHDVTAFVRSPEKLARNERLHIVPGRAGDPDAVAAALVGHDALLSALGPRPSEALRPHSLLTDLAASTGARQQFAFFRWLLRHHIRDLTTMERAFTRSHLDWTIARPPRLTDSRREERYTSAVDALPPGAAAFMLDAVERGEHRREIVGLSR